MDLFLLPSVGHQILDHLPVHQGLAAEEIHLQVPPVPGIGNQEIQGLFSHLVAHQGPASMVLALLREAVAAGQVAVMGDVEAEGLDHGGTFLKVDDPVLIGILREKRPLVLQGLHVLQHLPDLSFRPSAAQPGDDLLRLMLLIEADDLVCQLIHHMDRSAVHIQDNIVTVVIIAMNHLFLLLM